MKSLQTHRYLPWWPIAVVAAALLAAPVLAGDTPEQVRPTEAADDHVPRLDSSVADALDARGTAPLVARDLPPRSADDRGSVFTDAGESRTGTPLTSLEQEKLAAARAAVAHSRSAGTLLAPPPEAPHLPAAEIERIKQEQLAARRPLVLSGNDGSGVGEVPPPVQEVGASGLNAHEQAKVAGDLRGAPVQADAAPAAPTPTREQADGGQRKEGR
ncbi:MAG: hypothetical protein R6X25_06475 [Candidatus Krumholzibacteriia bacterium]